MTANPLPSVIDYSIPAVIPTVPSVQSHALDSSNRHPPPLPASLVQTGTTEGRAGFRNRVLLIRKQIQRHNHPYPFVSLLPHPSFLWPPAAPHCSPFFLLLTKLSSCFYPLMSWVPAPPAQETTLSHSSPLSPVRN